MDMEKSIFSKIENVLMVSHCGAASGFWRIPVTGGYPAIGRYPDIRILADIQILGNIRMPTGIWIFGSRPKFGHQLTSGSRPTIGCLP